MTSPTPRYGELGIKNAIFCSRSLHGERGLKLRPTRTFSIFLGSLPSRGAWIETGLFDEAMSEEVVAPFTGSVD